MYLDITATITMTNNLNLKIRITTFKCLLFLIKKIDFKIINVHGLLSRSHVLPKEFKVMEYNFYCISKLTWWYVFPEVCLYNNDFIVEDPEDLRREGVRNIPKSGYKLSRVSYLLCL